MRKNITQFNTDILDQSTDRKAETAQQHIEASERQAIVRDAVVALPQNQRELILLRDYHGFKYTEIDEILNVPIGTIMSRLSRVRKQLRLRLFDLEEIYEYGKLLAESREQTLDRMVTEAESLGGNAIVNVRIATSMVIQGSAEMLTYGTTVILKD